MTHVIVGGQVLNDALLGQERISRRVADDPLGARCNLPEPDSWTVPTSDTLPLSRPISGSSISARPSTRFARRSRRDP